MYQIYTGTMVARRYTLPAPKHVHATKPECDKTICCALYAPVAVSRSLQGQQLRQSVKQLLQVVYAEDGRILPPACMSERSRGSVCSRHSGQNLEYLRV
jgi:hypothetical protein